MFKRLGAALIVLLLACSYAFAQNKVQLCYTSITGTTVSCIDVSVANPLPVSASVSASISGFTAASTGTPISVTTGGVTGTLPAGAVVVATNVGATNGAYCALGASATTASQYLSPGGGWFAFTVGASTQLTCITSTSTTTVNTTGGAGLPTGTGGGGGGGGGGAITIASGAVASGAYSSGSIASGAIAAGAQVDLLTMRGSKAAGTAAANSLLAGLVYSATPVTLTDGQQAALQSSQGGNLRLMPGANWLAQTTWTTVTAGNTNLVLACGENSPAINVDLLGSGTISTGVVSFQYSNDATDCSGSTGTWANIPVSNALNQFTLAPQTNPFTLVSSDTAYLLLTNGVRAVRARLTTVITGSGGQVVITPTVGSINPALAALLNPLAAGSAIIGKVGIDQTTPNTTNHVSMNAYPDGATPITASATGTTGATTATLAGTSGKTTYICGYSIRANATGAATVTNTITGVITATLSSVMWIAPLASGLGIDEQIFSPCIPASGTNQGIAIVSGAPGSGGTVSSKGWGYQQ